MLLMFVALVAVAIPPFSRPNVFRKVDGFTQVVIKQGQILPIQSCIRALLVDAASPDIPLAASDAKLQRLSAMIASVLMYNQDLLPDSNAQMTPMQQINDQTDVANGHCFDTDSTVAQAAEGAIAAGKLKQASVLQGAISGPEAFEHSRSLARQIQDDTTVEGSQQSVHLAHDVDDDVGCNGLVQFFLAEMLGGSAT